MSELQVKCNISEERWNAVTDYHDKLLEIYENYKTQQGYLGNVAVSLATILQEISGVHSVRWRIKSPEHLIAKICRKIEEGNQKYTDISLGNYLEKVTDLIGIRVLHLLKDEFAGLHQNLISTWHVAEAPIAYLRDGDDPGLRGLYESLGLSVENHRDGYRSIHYIFTAQITKLKIIFELQVRTIFEEGWSEIDHRIRYPEFSDESLIFSFVNIFNRLCGAADEMGTFAVRLSKDIAIIRNDMREKERIAASINAELDTKINALTLAAAQNANLQSELTEIKKLVEKSRHQEITISGRRTDIPDITRLLSQVTFNESQLAKLRVITFPNIDEIIRSQLGYSEKDFEESANRSKQSILDSLSRSQQDESGSKANKLSNTQSDLKAPNRDGEHDRSPRKRRSKKASSAGDD